MSFSGMRRVLSNRNFLKLWIGQVVSNIGDEVAFIGLAALIVYRWEGTALDVSLFFIFVSLPVLIFGPIAGVFVDRWRRKRTMIWADLIRAGIVLAFAFPLSFWYILVLVFILSTVSRFFYPARNAMIPNLVKEEKLVEANSVSQITYILAIVIGPALGAFLVAFIGYTATFVFDSLSYIFSAAMIFAIRYREEIKKVAKKPLADMMDGFRYIRGERVVRTMLLIFFAITIVIGGLNVVYTLYVRDVLHMDVIGLGILEMSFGVGAVLGALLTGVVAGKVKNAYIIGGGMALTGLGIMLLGLVPILFIVIGLVATIGISSAMIQGPTNAIIQKAVKDEYRGKVFGAIGAMIQGSALISMGAMGFFIALFGIREILIASGIFLILSSLIFLGNRKVVKLIEIVD